nr:hypothetical protein [Tanacetum cinerariifolium]
MIIDDKDKANKEIIPKKRELNDDMYNWVTAKYRKLHSWTDSQFESITNDVYTTFFEKAEPGKPEAAKTRNVEAQQDVPECSRKDDDQECSNIKEKEDQQDSVPGSMKMIVSQKGPSKDLNDQDDEEIDEEDDEIGEEDNEIDEEADYRKDDSDDELWSPKK